MFSCTMLQPLTNPAAPFFARLAAKGVRLLAAGMWTPYVVKDLAAASSEALTSPRGQPALVAREQSPKSERGHG
jgi:hypothetical protein